MLFLNWRFFLIINGKNQMLKWGLVRALLDTLRIFGPKATKTIFALERLNLKFHTILRESEPSPITTFGKKL